jgi:hypothetical protein
MAIYATNFDEEIKNIINETTIKEGISTIMNFLVFKLNTLN